MTTLQHKLTNLPLDAKVISEAKAERWKAQNIEAIDGYNRWIEENGLPLDRFRQF